ncbi:ribonuclease R [Caproiciproducens galactitolivorans]|uniref:Ribonuclease R n=1 Tax=Caproiciproducens galactitolivorans TaxID=642589 RepID=A0A4Z0YMQ2_9FIRM|nr:ribonuclease R [Caproiciproducens galactitolivorans]QEY34304.1 ribonuclease R [Caproiciproducens galactitolivorans]TGJ77932.1 ribonuclease R [Caproiciproducens galactitolivorans]
MEDLKIKILEHFQHYPESITSRGLMKKLKIKNKKGFYNALNQLKCEGAVSVSKKHRIRPVEKKKTIKAKIVSLSKGFAFARPEDGGEDLFIHVNHLNKAFIGDTVLLKNVKESAKGPSADVHSISEKSSRTITGTLSCGAGLCELIPDGAIRYRLPVEKNSAKHLKDGDKVQAEIHRTPKTSRLSARIVKAYGSSGSAKICADAIIDQYGIKSRFPEEVLEEARKISGQAITEQDLKGRLDLRKTNICTIDGADAKDLDDAIFVSRTKKGYKLGVHIADVSHYVKEGSALDTEALERGTSVYFADRVIPMLPKELSNGVCSLNAGEDKLTFSAIIELDKTGTILSYQFKKSVINSKVRGVYSEVNQLFNKTADAELRKKYAPVIRSLNAARELANILKARSIKNGTVDLESTESKFTLNEEGICIGVEPRETGEAEQMIEQLMITANQAAAKFAKENGIPFVYRVHEQPDPERVAALADLVGALGLNAQRLKKDGEIRTADFADIMRQASGTPAQKVISHQLLRTMAKARYDTAPIGHFGLALADYCHFTSPIRRYPDTAIHRILSAMLKTKDKKELVRRYEAFAKVAASESSAAEVRAMQAERSAESCYMAEYMTQHIGECYDGIISGVTQRGVFVELPNSVEGFVPVDSFEGAKFHFDGVITQVDENTGRRLTIGQPLSVQVAAADVASGRIDFVPNIGATE